MVASASNDKTIALFNLKDLHPLLSYTRRTSAVAVGSDGRLVANAEEGGHISLWDIEHHRRLGSMNYQEVSLFDVVFSSNSKRLASLHSPSPNHAVKVKVWNTDSSRLITTLPVADVADAITVIFSPDNRQLIVLRSHGADLWDIAQRRRLRTPWGKKEEITKAAFSADGRLIAWISNNSVTIWNWTENRRLGKIKNIAGGTSVALSRDGSMLVTSGDDVILWDTLRQTRLGILGKGYQAVFSPNGQIVAATRPQSDDTFEDRQLIPIWDVGERVQLTTLAYQGELNRIAFTSDGKLVVAGDVTEVRDLDPSLAFRNLCNAVGRELSRSEWKLYLAGRKYHKLCP